CMFIRKLKLGTLSTMILLGLIGVLLIFIGLTNNSTNSRFLGVSIRIRLLLIVLYRVGLFIGSYNVLEIIIT
ncbi:hypothetical protein OFB65_24960, partial [Escherichia coli]|nr:hypothetical protein [Escherichia coli]